MEHTPRGCNDGWAGYGRTAVPPGAASDAGGSTPRDSETAPPGSAWAARAGDLADWALARLVNRRDCWGGYRPQEEWGRKYTRGDGTTGELGPQTTRKGRLTRALLARHFAARGRADVVGLHSTSPDGTSLWGGLDIDWHGPTSTAPDANRKAALAWYDVLRGRGFRPLLTDSNGRGGFHLLLLLAVAVLTPRVFHFLRQLVADHARHGMARPPETFPKQPVVRPRDGSPGFGNWLRLPGRHHSREHWSVVYADGEWVEGAEAVDCILTLTGDPPCLVPEAPPPTAPARHCQAHVSRAGGSLSARIAAHMWRLPNAGEGGGRDDIAYRFAAFLARDLALPDHAALPWLEQWDRGNSPPKGRECLAEILANARRYGRNSSGCGLGPLRTIREI
jgi:hypothetical protein